jgi:hypothetical protein
VDNQNPANAMDLQRGTGLQTAESVKVPVASEKNAKASDPGPRTETKMPAAQPPLNRQGAIHNAFLLGWLLMELRSRIQVGYQQCQLPNPPKGLGQQLAASWRTLFSRIVDLHHEQFPAGTTGGTLYDPPREPYLHPDEAPDYADIGIASAERDGAPVLAAFALYGETRRAINALSLLFIEAEESLVPDRIQGFQRRLIAAVLPAQTDVSDILKAKGELTEKTKKFLDAWDGYLREHLYVGGRIPNDELELIAYEAGYAMAGLSWRVSASTELLEAQDPPTDDSIKKIREVWCEQVFRDQDIIRVQHQITAFSSALDDEYYADGAAARKGPQSGGAATLDPDVPSEAIAAVKHSLDYWQRLAEWTAASKQGNLQDQLTNWKDLRIALTEQANVWQALMTGQQTLRSYTLESVTRRIMADVTQRIQSGLSRDFRRSLARAELEMEQLAKEAKSVVEHTASIALEAMERAFLGSGWLLGGILLIVITAVALIVLGLNHNANTNAASAAGGGLGLATALAGLVQLLTGRGATSEAKKAVVNVQEAAKQKLDAASKPSITTEAKATGDAPGLLGRVEDAARTTEQQVIESFQRGYEQVRVELHGLARNTAVAYPLVELFVTTFTDKNHQKVLLEKIIWNGADRNDEINRIITAAFGPLAVLITATGNDTNGTSKGA